MPNLLYRLLIMAVVTSVLLSGGCKSETKTAKPSDYFPVAEGNYWEYEGEGNEYASFIRQIQYTDKNRAQIREDNGGTVVAAIIETTDTAVIRVFSRAEAYGKENYLEKQASEHTVLLQTPIQTGTSWEIQEGIKEITDTEAVVNTPAGKFSNCIEVTTKFENSTVVEYYKEGIGLVKKEFKSEDVTVTSSLKNYKLRS